MAKRSGGSWLPRILFRLSLFLALALMLVVMVAPLCDNSGWLPVDEARWVALFARDRVLRRTAIASAIGLGVSACIFYRPQIRSRRAPPRPPSGPPSSENVVGA